VCKTLAPRVWNPQSPLSLGDPYGRGSLTGGEAVEPAAIIHTDGWSGHSRLKARGYRHQIVRASASVAEELLPLAHRVSSLLKRWLMSIHQGAVSHEHLDYYLDEFTFRFNRWTSRYWGKLFYRLMQQAANVDLVPYSTVVKHARGRKSKYPTYRAYLSE